MLIRLAIGLCVAIWAPHLGAIAKPLKVTDPQSISPFDEKELPGFYMDGERIDILGHVRPIDTYIKHESPQKIRPVFSIYTRNQATEGIEFSSSKDNQIYGHPIELNQLIGSDFDPDRKTIVVFPGYLTSDASPWMLEMKDLWLKLVDVNVILVHWHRNNKYTYSQAVANTPFVARQTSVLIYYLASISGVESLRGPEAAGFFQNLHFLGHSIGAHMAGFVSNDLGCQVGRITGLDPAGPSFDLLNQTYRLDMGDAKLVDVIHTNSGKMNYVNMVCSAPMSFMQKILVKLPVLKGLGKSLMCTNYTNGADTSWFGIDANIGHIDYYTNNGKNQPGCEDLLHVCDHSRAYEIILDLLKYEIDLKQDAQLIIKSLNSSLDMSSWRNSHRLLAFRAAKFEDFETGSAMLHTCPSLLTGADDTSGLLRSLLSKATAKVSKSRDFGDRLKGCTVPIDLVSPSDQFSAELHSEYGIDFKANSNDTGAPYIDCVGSLCYMPKRKQSFYFKTKHERPLVGEHYMLRLKLEPEALIWDNKCALAIEFNKDSTGSAAPTSSIGQLKLNGASFVANKLVEQLHYVSIPFVQQNHSAMRYQLDKLLDKQPSGSLDGDSNPLGNFLFKLGATGALPENLHLSLTQADSSNLVQVVKDNTYGRVTSKLNCSMSIASIEIQPIWHHKRHLSAFYDTFEPNSYKPKDFKLFHDQISYRDFIEKHTRLRHDSLGYDSGEPPGKASGSFQLTTIGTDLRREARFELRGLYLG